MARYENCPVPFRKPRRHNAAPHSCPLQVAGRIEGRKGDAPRGGGLGGRAVTWE